jgi:hypothetical protein
MFLCSVQFLNKSDVIRIFATLYIQQLRSTGKFTSDFLYFQDQRMAGFSLSHFYKKLRMFTLHVTTLTSNGQLAGLSATNIHRHVKTPQKFGDL